MSINFKSPKTLIAISAIFIILVMALTAAGIYYLFTPPQPQITQKTTVVIPKGASLKMISAKLYAARLIRSAWLFELVARQQGLTSKFQAGSFELSPNMTMQQLALKLTQGTNDLWVTIPEGWRMEEIADVLAQNKELTAFDRAEFVKLTEDLEGQLFPDTYLIPREVTAQAVVNMLTSTFEKKVGRELPEFVQLTQEEQNKTLILASLLQREGRGSQEMKHIAGILTNRLDKKMPLQVDATLQYAKGYDAQEKTWWPYPTMVDRKTPSLFNTYQNLGLPPRPICNPGIVAIEAALSPQTTTDLYYIHDNQGVIHYARTLDEHNRNISTYLR